MVIIRWGAPLTCPQLPGSRALVHRFYVLFEYMHPATIVKVDFVNVLDHHKVSENITTNKSNWSDNADHKLNSKQSTLHYVRE